MKNPVLCSLALLFLLTACQSTQNNENNETMVEAPPGPSPTEIKALEDAKFSELIAKFKADPNSVGYLDMWLTYLESSQIEDTASKQEAYENILLQLESGEITCDQVDWQIQTGQNFWSLRPHITAQTCYESLGDSESADFHLSAIEFILTGILGNGNGEHYYSAYEVATWGDAEDVIELSGFEVIDSYLQLRFFGQGLFYIYLVNDPQTGFQREVFFDTGAFLHKVLGIQYPFAGIDNSLETKILDLFAEQSGFAMIGKAEQLATAGQFDDAAALYERAAIGGSPVANYRLGELCLAQDLAMFYKDQCLDYIFNAAELGYHKATLALAFAYREGLVVDKDESIFEQLFKSVDTKLEAGEAWRVIANMYLGDFGLSNEVKSFDAIKASANAGNPSAKLALIKRDNRNKSAGEEKDFTHQRLHELAEAGYGPAQELLARYILSNSERGSQAWNDAEIWIKKAADQYIPSANNLLGNAYHHGHFGKTDKLKAYLAHVEAATDFHPASQLYVGYENEMGYLVETDKRLAVSWYFLCSKGGNLNCHRNVGVFFRDGIVLERNYEVAMAFFELAAKQGHLQSMTDIGLMHWSGSGRKKDRKKATQIFVETCEKGGRLACYRAAYSYEQGKGVRVDMSKANYFFGAACELDDSRSCIYLAESYEQGEGIEIDLGKATELFNKSCLLGNRLGCSNYERIKNL